MTYPDCLTDENLKRIEKAFPETANDLRCWRDCNKKAELFNLIKEEQDGLHRKNRRHRRHPQK